tara:strand:+ start:2271 stop:2405 length:135 start_codon:yes stop_codon:yes gene_type:complete
MEIDFNLSKEKKHDLYYQALIMAFKTFLEEEQRENIFTEKKINE